MCAAPRMRPCARPRALGDEVSTQLVVPVIILHIPGLFSSVGVFECLTLRSMVSFHNL